MTLSECIKKYGLTEQKENCFGFKYHPRYKHYHAERENEKSTTIYHADNEISADLDDGKTFYFTIERISKTRFKSNGLPYISRSKIIELQAE
jgi:hypothetical protein